METARVNSVHQTLEEYNRAHLKRWALSIDWIERHVHPKPDWSVLEVSHPSHFTDLVRARFSIKPSNTDFDVRDPTGWNALGRGVFDFVINTEVIEHLPDWFPPLEATVSRSGEFYKTGVRNCLNGCFHVLKPGGFLFLTTPNTSSIQSLAHWIHYAGGFTWDFHVREYGFADVVSLVQEAGFEIVTAGTESPYLHMQPQAHQGFYKKLAASLGSIGAAPVNRGETTFIVAVKKRSG